MSMVAAEADRYRHLEKCCKQDKNEIKPEQLWDPKFPLLLSMAGRHTAQTHSRCYQGILMYDTGSVVRRRLSIVLEDVRRSM